MFVACSCSVDTVYYADPAFAALYPAEDVLERELASVNEPVALLIDPGSELSTTWLEEQLQQNPPSTAVLSLFYSLFAVDLAAAYPDVRFVAIGDGSVASNLVRVTVSMTVPAQRAGAVVAEYVAAAEEDMPIALFLGEHTPERRDVAAAFHTGVSAGGVAPRADYRYNEPVGRDQLRRDVREAISEGARVFVVLTGTENATALDQLSAADVVIVTEYQRASGAREDRVLVSLELPLDRIVAAGLGAEPGTTVSVEGRVVAGGAMRDELLNVMDTDADD